MITDTNWSEALLWSMQLGMEAKIYYASLYLEHSSEVVKDGYM